MSEEKTPPPTPAELEARSKELTTFYKKELPLLRLRAEYEGLLTKIDVAKMQRLEIMMAKAEMMEGPQGQGPGPQGAQPEEKAVEHVRPVNSEKESKPKTIKIPKSKGKRALKKVK